MHGWDSDFALSATRVVIWNIRKLVTSTLNGASSCVLMRRGGSRRIEVDVRIILKSEYLEGSRKESVNDPKQTLASVEASSGSDCILSRALACCLLIDIFSWYASRDWKGTWISGYL